jgi:hypothetical protein
MRVLRTYISVVIAGLDPAIHTAVVGLVATRAEWMPWSSHGMTTILEGRAFRLPTAHRAPLLA